MDRDDFEVVFGGDLYGGLDIIDHHQGHTGTPSAPWRTTSHSPSRLPARR